VPHARFRDVARFRERIREKSLSAPDTNQRTYGRTAVTRPREAIIWTPLGCSDVSRHVVLCLECKMPQRGADNGDDDSSGGGIVGGLHES
jgi:hypothetical protein